MELASVVLINNHIVACTAQLHRFQQYSNLCDVSEAKYNSHVHTKSQVIEGHHGQML